MTIQYDNTTNRIIVVGGATNIPINIQPKGTGGLNLLGSGQNLLTNTVSLATTWTQSNISVTGSQSDPFGGTSAFLINDGTATAQHTFFQATTSVSNTYTLSIYAKAGTANFIGIYTNGVNAGVIFNINTGAFSANINNAPTSFSITAVGGGWYRCSIVTTGAQTFSQFFVSEDGTNLNFTGTSKTITVYAPQLEIGSVTNTYIPTTTTAVYGTPTLTFSGVAGLGLQSDGSLYVQPAGTGAIQAQPTTSTTTGGNARGANAVDWQTSRDTAAKVASGIQAVIGGGGSNVSNNAASTVAGGSGNQATNAYSGVLSGIGQTASGFGAIAIGGYTNTAAGFWNFIGSGFTNSGTSGSAVTTQATTTVTSGSTAVTLSGSNANIKVGQLITGTGIQTFPNTYVSAISGTSLTLSQNAIASGSPTLSFFTPHGVVVGGGNNQATGSYSFIGGGGDAGTAGNRNTASGDWSTVCGGWKNVASGYGAVISGGGLYGVGQGGGNTANGAGSTISGGSNHTASGFLATVAGGYANNATQNGSVVTGGWSNTATSAFGTVNGGNLGTTRSITGYSVFPSCSTPISSSVGVSQAALLILARETTNATPTVLASDGNAAGTTNQVILPNNSAYYFRGEVISGVTSGGNTKGWFIEGVIKRGANAASTALVGTPTVTSNYADAGASTWTIAVTADTTNGGLAITFTGQAGTTIRTVAQIRTTEMTY